MRTQSISRLLYYPITFYARSSPSNSLISLSPAPYFPFYPSSSRETTATRITISGERRNGVETGREQGGRDIEGVTRRDAGFVRQRGSWFEWSYATWLEILSNLRLHITWQQRCARLQIEPASVADRSNPTMITNVDMNVNVGITFSFEFQMDDKEDRNRESQSPLCDIYIYISSSCDFSNCDSRRSSLRTQTRIRLFSFVLHGSSPSKRVPLWSLWATLRNPSSIIFWSRICSILERRGARCLEPTSRTWLESLVSLRLYGASKAGQGNGSVKMYGRAVPRFLVRWRQGWETGSGLVSPWHEIPRWKTETRNWWTPISMPELPFVAFRPCIIAFALNTPEFRTRIVGTEPH